MVLLWLLQDVDVTVMQSMSDSLDAVNTAAEKLHNLSTQQFQVCPPSCRHFDWLYVMMLLMIIMLILPCTMSYQISRTNLELLNASLSCLVL